MKIINDKKFQILSLVCAGMLLQGGCATTDVQSFISPATARTAAAIACTGTLTYAVKDADRPTVAAYVYSVAQGIRSLAGGTVPSPEQLKTTVALFTHGVDVGQWAILSTSLQGIYSGLYGHLQGNPKLAAQYLEAIAQGAEDAAGSYVHVSPTPAPTP